MVRPKKKGEKLSTSSITCDACEDWQLEHLGNKFLMSSKSRIQWLYRLKVQAQQ
jgi:hypothetical protein